jgi:hypothetical protein
VIERQAHDADGMKTMKIGLEDVYELPEWFDRRSLFQRYIRASWRTSQPSIAQLGRITKTGGIGFHQIDFRDHRNFERPLDYLTIADEDFSQLLAKSELVLWQPWRYTQFQSVFEENGFDVSFTPNMFASENYLNEIYPHVREKFKSMSVEALRVLGGRFVLRKKRHRAHHLPLIATCL